MPLTRHIKFKYHNCYFVIMGNTKMVREFAMSSVVRGYHENKDVGVLPMTKNNFLVKENRAIQEIAIYIYI